MRKTTGEQLANVPAGEDDNVVLGYDLVNKTVWEAAEQGTAYDVVIRKRVVHARDDSHELHRNVELAQERTAQASDLDVVPATGLADLRARLRSKPNAHGNQRVGGDPPARRRSSAA